MKTIIINGCSFVAGDEVVWQQYHKEHNQALNSWWKEPDSAEYDEFCRVYRTEYRRLHNLSAMIAKNLNCKCVDLSADGNSNDSITMDTIAHILTIDPRERSNYHVVIGWTTLCRYLRYTKAQGTFFNLNVGHFDPKHLNPTTQELANFIQYAMIDGYPEDFFFNFVQNIMLLENFLKANNITYTFYKSLGTPEDMKYCTLGRFTENRCIPKELVTDHSRWLKFSDSGDPLDHEYLPYAGHSWNSSTLKQNSHMFISAGNCHPNLEAIAKVSTVIADFIKHQKIL